MNDTAIVPAGTKNNADSNDNMIQVRREDLERIYENVDAFRQMLAGDILRRTESLYMTDGYEGMEAICGDIGAILDSPGYVKLTVSSQETRSKLRDAYGKASACSNNAKEETELQQACLSLCACWYAVLNDVYDPGKGSDEAIGRVIEASRYCLDLLAGLKEAGRASFEEMAKDPGGPMPHDFLDVFEAMASRLQPRYDPTKIETDANDQEGGNNHEEP